ncbi:tetratricopeptide repeat protein [Nodularia harveyana UHCC-0300]|uniref:Tetratricopeptide repeat protein n=1 Tax=Nodularia harveyana UHCC-0300 TaxID=2974287 RepID=A0ABU5UGZ2_9CYAN|nr:tetratricopeptide repeat protein [Nodularia harveyana]MEA5582588.1 tetratricopeptide repeat protein [Nodularia harveyana UHCC-0300]
MMYQNNHDRSTGYQVGKATGNNHFGNVYNYRNNPQSSIPNNIPYRGVANFVGRDQQLKDLHDKLQPNQRSAFLAVAGMGGVGKTQLAVQYAQQYKDNYLGGLCWLDARKPDLATEIIEFARLCMNLEAPQTLLSAEKQAKWCWNAWEPPAGRVLVVLDNVDDLGDWQKCHQLLPKNNRFCVLITTRLRNLGADVEEVNLEKLSPENALKLLRDLLGKQDRRVERELETAKNLCKWLGYLPLGLQVVGANLREDPDLSLKEILEQLPTQETSQLQAPFALSWQKLDPMTRSVGELLSLFAPDIIPWNLVESVSERLNWAKTYVDKARKQLYQRYLIEREAEGEGCYKIHPLIKEFLRGKLVNSNTANYLKKTFAAALVEIAQKIPDSLTLEDITLVQLEIPHLAEVATDMITAVRDEDLIWPFVGLGRFYEGQGLYTLAEPWYQQCLSQVQDRLGDNHPDVAASLNNLAEFYRSQGRYDEAEPLFLQALELRKRLLGDNHPDVATSLNNLANLYSDQGRYDEAEPLYLQDLELSKRLLGDNHPDVATSLNNLAALYKSQGRYDEAEPLYLQALELRQRLLGDNHPDVANSLNNLANLYSDQGRYDQAEPLYLQALELRKRLLGDNHPDVATSLNNLAELYYSQGRYDQAEPLYLQALELRKHLLGDNHPDVANSLNNLAALYYSQGRYDQAEPLYLQALELRKRLLGDNHPSVATSLNNLAYLYDSQGRYDEAEPLYLQALSLHKRLLGDNHPSVATSLNNLALLYKSQGRYDQAEPLYLQALELRKHLLGDNHPHVATSLNNLALLYYSQGKYDQAEPLYLQALEIAQRVLGDNHPNTVTFRQNLEIARSNISFSNSWLGKFSKFFQ